MVRQEERKETVVNAKNFVRKTIKLYGVWSYILNKQMRLNRKIMAFTTMYKKISRQTS